MTRSITTSSKSFQAESLESLMGFIFEPCLRWSHGRCFLSTVYGEGKYMWREGDGERMAEYMCACACACELSVAEDNVPVLACV